MDADKNRPSDRSSAPNSANDKNNLNTIGSNTIRFMKGRQNWTFRYTIGCEIELINLLESYAQDPDCDLDWFDIAILCKQIELWLENCLNRFSRGKSDGGSDGGSDGPAISDQFTKTRIHNNNSSSSNYNNRIYENDK